MIYVELFWSFFKIGLFTVGGGLAALPLIQAQVVTEHGWLTLTEFTDLVTIAQLTPGPIGINAATFVGTRVGGLGGAVIASFSCILGPCIVVSIMAWFYFRYEKLSVVQGVLAGLRPAVVALIASAGVSISVLAFWGEAGFSTALSSVDWIAVVVFAVALALLKRFKWNPVLVMLGCGAVGGAVYLFIV